MIRLLSQIGLWLIIMLPTNSRAQFTQVKNPTHYKSFIILSDDSQLWTVPRDISRFEILDTARMRIIYRHTYPVHYFRGTVSLDRQMCLVIGDRKSDFYCVEQRLCDSIQTRILQDGRRSQPEADMDLPAWSICCDRDSRGITNLYRVPFSDKLTYEYEESIPEIAWRIDADTCRILGYSCQHATGEFRGRCWSVWFTPELPVWSAPFKFFGLPGLILLAEDNSGDYRFAAIGIDRRPEPIYRYGWTYKKISRKLFRRFERSYHTEPLRMIDQGGTIQVINSSRSKTTAQLTNEWTIPYNPIELE